MSLSPVGLFNKTVKFSDVKFEKGMVKRFGFKFNGEINDILRNGDSVVLKVKKGQIFESVRKGQQNFLKKFFPMGDKLHDNVYKYDLGGNLISRFRKTQTGSELLDLKGKLLRQYYEDKNGKFRSVTKNIDEKTALTMTYSGSKPARLVIKGKDKEFTFIDFMEGILEFEGSPEKSKRKANMKNGVLVFQNNHGAKTYDLNNKTLAYDDEMPELIMQHHRQGYDSTTGIDLLKKQCEDYIPQGYGKRFFDLVVAPFFKEVN